LTARSRFVGPSERDEFDGKASVKSAMPHRLAEVFMGKLREVRRDEDPSGTFGAVA
jgi:hypothetical protein